VPPAALELETEDVEATLALAERAAAHLGPGDVVALVGELGAGKTRFVTGACRGLGYRGRVRSPSFTLLNVYRGDRVIYHFDLYRWEPGEHAAELAEWEERMDGDGVTFIEWAERLGDALPERAWRVTLAFAGENGRRLTVEAPGERRTALEASLASWMRR
jgi:tRNA threonylcarbamoyladenosine biosynthesis protein TsaE